MIVNVLAWGLSLTHKMVWVVGVIVRENRNRKHKYGEANKAARCGRGRVAFHKPKRVKSLRKKFV